MMLSKMKSSQTSVAAVAPETRSSNSHTINQMTQSDNEEDLADNDSNNNNNNNNNSTLNNNQQTKKSQSELLDIVEVSRKRRLSKDSADSLGSFIKWSFSHLNKSIQLLSEAADAANNNISNNNNNHQTISGRKFSSGLKHLDEEHDQDQDDAEAVLDDEDDWQSLDVDNRSSMQQITEEMLLRRHSKLAAASGGSSSANLALIRNCELTPSSVLNEARASKRARLQLDSPEEKPSQFSSMSLSMKKSNSHLGSVVERLHQQQQQQHHHQQQQQQQQQQHQLIQQAQQRLLPAHQLSATKQEPAADREVSSNENLSYHLQQFLQQQTSLEDLCSSVGLDDSNQLVLAAAIHRALVDSVGPTGGGQTDNKSDAASIGSSTGSSSQNNSSGSGSSNGSTNLNQAAGATSAAMQASSGANLHLIHDSMNRQNRVYNTRGAAMHGLGSGLAGPTGATLARGSSYQASSTILSNRAQQQRHAQAAAALSALASVGSHPISGATPIVDFECDTCGSSFDDRHRLMQHQSIHLELKKNWFTETPVDEVMKIFNRRRGEFLCNTCNLRFEATFDYDKHNHSVHGQRPYCCQFCGNGTRTFRFWRQYLNHLYDHRYIFSCTIANCDFTVNRRDSLRFHIFRFHLNCQLPQNQHHPLRPGQPHNNNNMLLGANNNNNDNCGLGESKWNPMDEDDDDEDVGE